MSRNHWKHPKWKGTSKLGQPRTSNPRYQWIIIGVYIVTYTCVAIACSSSPTRPVPSTKLFALWASVCSFFKLPKHMSLGKEAVGLCAGNPNVHANRGQHSENLDGCQSNLRLIRTQNFHCLFMAGPNWRTASSPWTLSRRHVELCYASCGLGKGFLFDTCKWLKRQDLPELGLPIYSWVVSLTSLHLSYAR